MADEEKEGEVVPSRGADWEVVSLTASAYAAAPDPKESDPKESDPKESDPKDDDNDESNQESSNAMFLSGHFVFPPNEHENLPLEPEASEVHNESDDITYAVDDEETEEVTESFNEVEHEEFRGLEVLHTPHSESVELSDTSDHLDKDVDSPHTNVKSSKGDNGDGDSHPCAAWLKKHAASLYCHAKEANTFWSIVVVAALAGIVILGKKWHKGKWHSQECKGHMISDEKIKGVVGPMGRLKNIMIGSYQRAPVKGFGAAATS